MVVTPYFPIQQEPYRGHSAYQTLLRMREWADIHVISPLAVYPNLGPLQPRSYRYHRADLQWRAEGLSSEYAEYPVVPVISRPFNGFSCLRQILPRVRAARPDILLNYWLYPEGWATAAAARRLGIPSVAIAIGSDVKRIPDAISRYFVKRTLREISFLITVSADLRQSALELGAKPELSRAILNGCDTSIFHPAERGEARQELGVPLEASLVLFVGSLIPEKGLRELVAASAKLAARRPGILFACIGEGPFGAAFRQLIQEAGVANRFLLPGRASAREVARWLAACDVFTLPSYSEGCPNVVLEAMACGRPVVATRVGGIPELVTEENGFLVARGDHEDLEHGLEAALQREWDAGALSGRFSRSWEQVAAETWAVCEALLQRQP